MRLIDADELKKKIRHWNYNATTSTPTFKFVTDEDIDYMPTVDILDKMRDEIDDLDRHYDNDYFSGNDDAMFKCDEVLQIIDKYRGDKE